ncbi:MAG: metallophosphoesterase, partial [Bacteroidia bacterium]
KVMIAGNHDFFFEKYSVYDVQAEIPDNVIYLNDSGCQIEGINIWGSPIQPWFFDWAFNRKRGEEIRKHWALIPENTDILITHGPPYGILDKVVRDNSPVGCRDLLKKVQEIQPKYHIFGHIHEGRGQFFDGNTNFLNASVLDEKYRLVFEPMQFELEPQNANGKEIKI